jgi:MFS family permease
VFFSQSVLMWILMKKLHLSPIGLLAISSIANVGHLLVYASLSLNHSETVAYSNILLTSFMFIGLPASNAYLSSKIDATQQGLAMGTLDSVRSLVGSFGPILFSFLYSYFGENYSFPQAPFLFGAVFASFSPLVILGPLRLHAKRTAMQSEDNIVTEPFLGMIA